NFGAVEALLDNGFFDGDGQGAAKEKGRALLVALKSGFNFVTPDRQFLFEFLPLAEAQNIAIFSLDSPLLHRRGVSGIERPADFQRDLDKIMGGGSGGPGDL